VESMNTFRPCLVLFIISRRMVFPERHQRISQRFFTVAEARAIISQAQEPFATLFALAAVTGMRAGELLALQTGDIDWDRGTVTVMRSVWYGHVAVPKTLASERVLPLPQLVITRLQGYLDGERRRGSEYLFQTSRGNPLPIQHVVQRKLWPILDRLGIARCGLHAFRHTHSSMLVEMGAPMTVARDQLGHTDMRLTLATYSHVIGDGQRLAIEKIASVLCPSVTTTKNQLN